VTNKYKGQQQVYAVVRVDHYAEEDEHRVTVKEIVSSLELAEAEAEVERFNALNADKDCHYFWQTTRLYPEGTSAGTEE
jgi:hypothetical protein